MLPTFSLLLGNKIKISSVGLKFFDRHSWFQPILMLVLAGMLASCAGPSAIRLPLSGDGQHLATVPFFPQEAYQCGPAALAMALAWSGVAVTPHDLVPEVYTASIKGSLQSAMIASVRRQNRIAYLLDDPQALIEEIAAGHPVVVLQNLGLGWYPVWHYAVAIGWEPDGSVLLHSGTTPGKSTPVKTFERTWARSDFWGLLVLPPSRLPATATAVDYLKAVGHLKRRGNWTSACQAYEAALVRWPHNLAATVGVGDCLYQMGNLASAEKHYRAASQQFPSEGVVFNNLAWVLFEQGRREAALEAARYAIACGGPLKIQFEETFETIHNHDPRDSSHAN